MLSSGTRNFSSLMRSLMVGVSWCLCLMLQVASAQGQMFGSRTVGSPLGNRTTNAAGGVAGQNSGILTGSERFVRGNRSRRDFVGADRDEAEGFVGASQAIGVGRVRSATEGLRIETTNETRINRPLPRQPAKGMYYPRLEIDLDETAADTQSQAASVANTKLQSRVERIAGSAVTLAVEDRVAILRGSVGSRKDAEMLAAILSFEPGIDAVRNELRIADGS